MEEAVGSARNPPSLGYRYGDDTFTKLHCCHVKKFSQHLNSRDPHVKFTLEPEEDAKLTQFLKLTIKLTLPAQYTGNQLIQISIQTLIPTTI